MNIRVSEGLFIFSSVDLRFFFTFAVWRNGRVVDRGGLENRCACEGTGGSNPSFSAKTPALRYAKQAFAFFGDLTNLFDKIPGKSKRLIRRIIARLLTLWCEHPPADHAEQSEA